MELALESAKKAHALNDSNPLTYALMARIYSDTGMQEKALAAGEKALELEPNGADVNAIQSLILMRLGRYEEGLSCAKKAIKLNPIAPGFYYLFLGLNYAGLNQNEKAIVAYEEGIKVNPDYVLLRYFLALALLYNGQYERAIATFNKIIKQNPKFIDAYIGLAACYSPRWQKQ